MIFRILLPQTLLPACLRKFKCSKTLHYFFPRFISTDYGLITPELDFEERLEQYQDLQENLISRGNKTDLKELCQEWETLKYLREKKVQLEESRKEVVKDIKQLGNHGIGDSSERFKQLQLEGRKIREKHRLVATDLRAVEDSVLPKIAKLPNDLHCDTPINSDKILYESGEHPRLSFSPASHVYLGIKHGVSFKCVNPKSYFLFGSCADFEYNISEFAAGFLKRKQFKLFANPDFCRDAVTTAIDGANGFSVTDINETETENHLNLVGGGSLAAFCAYHARQIFNNPEKLPLKYFTIGRNYTKQHSIHPGLFGVQEATVVDLFVLFKCLTLSDTDHTFEHVCHAISDIYDLIGLHYVVKLKSAQCLSRAESKKISFQMYSQYLDSYLEVGFAALYDDYLSKRLHMCYSTGQQSREFLHVVHARVFSIPVLLGCIMENQQDQFGNITFPSIVKSS